MPLSADDKRKLEILQGYYRKTGRSPKGKKALERVLRYGVDGIDDYIFEELVDHQEKGKNGSERRNKRSEERQQWLQWWASLDASAREKISKALQDFYCRTVVDGTGKLKTGRRPRKAEMKELILKALA